MAKRGKPRTSGERPAVPAPACGTGRRRRRIWALAIFIAAIATVGLAFQTWRHLFSESGPGSPGGPAPAFVGRQTCAGCHQKEHALWQGSHHDLAMQKATDATVLGDFKNTTFTRRGLTSTFSRRDGKFFVRTDGPDGKLHDYEIAYTFGVAPLQQYLIAFLGGRYQALSIAWDSRPKSDGGQRWFHLYPNERIAAGDELHWTQPSQNWNFMCAECHSTDLRKRYVAAEDRYETTWAELNVSCEACHGPGSAHVAWTERTKRGGAGAADGQRGFVVQMDRRAARR